MCIRDRLNITAAISTKSTFLSLFDAGIIIAINIAYNVIPIASASDVGSRLFIKAPSTVPSVQPMYGIAISPDVYKRQPLMYFKKQLTLMLLKKQE